MGKSLLLIPIYVAKHKTYIGVFFLGNMVLFEPYSLRYDEDTARFQQEDVNIKLKDIPRMIYDSNSEEMRLVGVIHHYSPRNSRRSTESGVGHYVAIAYRRDGRWVLYNDLGPQEEPKKATFLANLSLLVYVKT